MRLPTPTEVLAALEPCLARAARVALCHVVRTEGSTPGKSGWKLLVRADGSSFGNLGGGAFEALVQRDAKRKLAELRPRSELKRYYFTETAVRGDPTGMVCGGMAEVFLEVLQSRPVLLIFGGGPVGQALAHQGRLCGFEVVVVEDRPEFLRPDLFPVETRLAEVDESFAGDYLGDLREREVYAAVVTRCWETDLAALRSLLSSPPRGLLYLGLMGSRRKVARVRRELEASGVSLGDIDLKAPIGLEIGAATPAEIAVSILAEIIREQHRD